jgi:hypothetical protein
MQTWSAGERRAFWAQVLSQLPNTVSHEQERAKLKELADGKHWMVRPIPPPRPHRAQGNGGEDLCSPSSSGPCFLLAGSEPGCVLSCVWWQDMITSEHREIYYAIYEEQVSTL